MPPNNSVSNRSGAKQSQQISKLLSVVLAGRGELPSLSGGLFFVITALFIFTIATVLRVYHLGVRSLWFDEALAAEFSRGTFAGMLEQIRLRDSAPLLHPYILFLMQKVG